MNDTIKLANGKVVSKEAYIVAKTKDLIEFGYTDLTNKTVEEQLEKVLKGEELSIIGKFIEGDIEL